MDRANTSVAGGNNQDKPPARYRMSVDVGLCFDVYATSDAEAIRLAEQFVRENQDGISVPGWDGDEDRDMRLYTDPRRGTPTIEDVSEVEDECDEDGEDDGDEVRYLVAGTDTPLTSCPDCGHNLTAAGGIEVVLADGKCHTWECPDRLRDGRPVDTAHQIAQGLHSTTLCGGCREQLAEIEGVDEESN